METAAATAAGEIAAWREFGERLGIGALIVGGIFVLLWKSGSFLGPLITKLFERVFSAFDSVGALHASINTATQRIADSAEHSVRHTSALEAAVEFAGELAVKGTLPEERAQHHVERVKERLRG